MIDNLIEQNQRLRVQNEKLEKSLDRATTALRRVRGFVDVLRFGMTDPGSVVLQPEIHEKLSELIDEGLR